MGMKMNRRHKKPYVYQSISDKHTTTNNSNDTNRGYRIKVYSEKQKPLLIRIAYSAEKKDFVKLVQTTKPSGEPSLRVYSLEQLPLLEKIALGTIVSTKKNEKSNKQLGEKDVRPKRNKGQLSRCQTRLNLRKRGGDTHFT